jgi:hypothetical protein
MTNARDVRSTFNAVCKAHTSDFTKSRIGLLWRGSKHTRTDASFLRASVKRGAFCLVCKCLPPLADQLIDGWHTILLKYLRPGSVPALAREVEKIEFENRRRAMLYNLGSNTKDPQTGNSITN